MFAEFPSLHPLVVHFPVVLLAAAPFFQAGGLLFRKRDWLLGAFLLLVAGALGAYLASYVFHAEPFDPSETIKAVFEKHKVFAAYTFRVSLLAILVKLPGFSARIRHTAFEAGAFVLMFAAAVLVIISGHLGAELTHVFHVKAE